MVEYGELPGVAEAKLDLKTGAVGLDNVAHGHIKDGREINFPASGIGVMNDNAVTALHRRKISIEHISPAAFDVNGPTTGETGIFNIDFLTLDLR